ncbi:MAG: hypothetical protein JRI25_02625 [Deltaproteobacteria bacterium]|nr:hypothetical protein [Deltaproteobacteria bacterium]
MFFLSPYDAFPLSLRRLKLGLWSHTAQEGIKGRRIAMADQLIQRCRALVVTCIDYRLHNKLTSFLSDRGLDTDGADVIRVSGGVRMLIRPAHVRDREWLMDQLRYAYEVHGVREFHLINHEDCGVYGPELEPDPEAEFVMHRQDLRSARALIERTLGDVTVCTWLMREDEPLERVEFLPDAGGPLAGASRPR